jgi:SAM-dependent methyltransferase
MGKKKANDLLQAVVQKFKQLPKGKILDLGCGDGDYSIALKEQGFDVMAGDIDKQRFRYTGQIPFEYCDVTKVLPFKNSTFDYVLLMEVVEHLKNPYDVLTEINRVIKNGGSFILSTPNILNLKSRFRFLFEGAYEYFREPPLDQVENPKEKIFNLHLVPYRYHELEYLLAATGFKTKDIFTSIYEGSAMGILAPLIRLQAYLKEYRSIKKNGIDYRRINKILFSKELLFGRHLIIRAEKSS